MQNVNDRLSNKFLVAIFQDRKGNIWFGTHGSGASKYDPITKRVTYFKHDPDNAKSISHNVVWSIAEDALGFIWMATDQGLNKLDTATGAFTRFFHNPNDPNSLNTSFVTRVLCDSTMNVWVATGEGLNCIDARSNVVTRIGDANQRASGAIASLAEDKDGMMWVGLGSLLRLDTKRKTFVGSPTTESVKLITSITVSRNDAVWVGTYGFGFQKFNPKDGTSFMFTERDGLPNNVVYGILEDNHRNLWMSTNKGIAKFNPQTRQFKNYDVKDGLQSNEFNRGAFCKTADGMMLFGGINGFNAFYPDSIRDNVHVPPVVFSLFKKFDEPVIFDSSLAAMNEIVLRHDENFFSFEFAALDFTEPTKNRHMYMLEGLEREWVNVGTRRNARYTNVDPGEYVFRVKAANNDGVWNERGASVKLRIIPPFWKTSWFLVIAGVLLAGSFGGMVRYISTRKLKQQLEELERERAVQRERERISRDLHDHVDAQLVNIISGLDLVGKYSPPTEKRSERLLKSLQQDARSSMMQLRETIWAIRGKSMPLAQFVEQVENYSRRQMEFQDEAEFSFEAHCDGDVELSPIQVLNCFRIVQEALTNCAKHAKATNIRVEVHSTPNSGSKILVRDDGVGLQNGTNGEMHGNGVLNMTKRAEEIGGTFSISQVNGRGTEVMVEIPVLSTP
jgi:signal transduction histidine kinase/streptogramin lyase